MKRVILGLLSLLLILGISTSAVLADDTKHGSVSEYVTQENSDDDQEMNQVEQYNLDVNQAEQDYLEMNQSDTQENNNDDDQDINQSDAQEYNKDDGNVNLANQANNDGNLNEEDDQLK